MVHNSHCPTTVLNLIVIKPGKVQTILIFFGLLFRILVGYHVGGLQKTKAQQSSSANCLIQVHV